MADSVADQESNAGSSEAGERGRESEGTGAALGGILLGQPERVDGEVRAAQTQEEQTNEKPWQRSRAEIEDLSEGERDEHHHQRKEESERAAAAEPFRQRRHGQAS